MMNGNSVRGRIIDETIAAGGHGVTFEQVKKALSDAGHKECRRGTFEAHRRAAFPDWNFRWNKPKGEEPVTEAHDANGHADGTAGPLGQSTVTRVPAVGLPVKPYDNDWLSKFVSFALAVEKVGGIEAAERMLRALKEMPK
jgi:hypothetical protein